MIEFLRLESLTDRDRKIAFDRGLFDALVALHNDLLDDVAGLRNGSLRHRQNQTSNPKSRRHAPSPSKRHAYSLRLPSGVTTTFDSRALKK